MKISQILDKIDEYQLFIPAFQREYVWSKENVKELISSLIKEYPTGTLLTWETNRPPELKGSHKYSDSQGAVKLILDGQQRITSLYLLIRNSIPPYYTKDEIKTNLIELKLYVKIDDKNAELQYYKPKTMSNNPCWVSITDIFQKKIRSREIISALKRNGLEVSEEQQDIIDDNFSKIEKILDREFLEQNIPVKASLKEAIDIFYIVNAGGVNLTDAELALAQISGYWPNAREVFKKKLVELKDDGFDFKLDFIVYLLLGTAYHMGSDMKKLHDPNNKDKLQKIWAVLQDKTIDYLITLLKTHCKIENRDEINHIYALVPMAVYLYNHDNRLSEFQIKKMMRWFLYSQIRERYVSQLGTKLDHDIKIVCEKEDPFVVMLDEIKLERPLTIVPDEFIGKPIRSPLFNLMKLCFKSKGAICLGTGVSLMRNMGKRYTLDDDHIFPWAKLRDNGYDKNNTFKYNLAQELTNREILCTDENRWKKKDMDAFDYLSEVKKRYPNALHLQCIPEDERLWSIDRYEDFLSVRREMLSRELNEFLDSFVFKKEDTIDVKSLIQRGECQNVEFKSSIRWDYKENTINKKLEFVIAKTLCGFLNSDGGTLIIGVDDGGNILGLDRDYNTLNKHDKDGFQLALNNIINTYLGKDVWLDINIVPCDDKEVCVIKANPSKRSIFVKNEGKEEFYIRRGSSTTPLSFSEMEKYISGK